jgi:D-amino-acid dehydrogenase
LEIKVRDDLGVKQKLLSVKEILDLEPNLKPVFSGGVYFDYASHARDPGEFLKKYLNFLFKEEENLLKKM